MVQGSLKLICMFLLLGWGCAPAVESRSESNYGYRFQDASGVVFFEDQLGPTFKLVAVDIVIDGEQTFRCDDDERELDARSPVRVFDGSLSSGDHQLGVKLRLKGHGYGIFAYLADYRFKVNSTHDFSVESGKRAAIKIISYEKGGATTPLEERPDIRFEETNGSDIPAASVDVCPWM